MVNQNAVFVKVCYGLFCTHPVLAPLIPSWGSCRSILHLGHCSRPFGSGFFFGVFGLGGFLGFSFLSSTLM